jgi:hypothetical protein
MDLFLFGGATALVVLLLVATARANELFVLRVSRGRVEVVRGGVPPRLLADLRDVLRRDAGADGVVRVTTDAGRARVDAKGKLAPELLQRLRNVVGTWDVAKIRAGRRAR